LKKVFSLDVGAGENPRGDVNVDIRHLSQIDIICTALCLPFKDETFGRVFLNYVIEHFRYRDVVSLLKEINRVTKPNGLIEIRVPNFQSIAVLLLWLTGRTTQHQIPMVAPMLTGDQDYKENVHLSLWTVKLLKLYLKSTGFNVLKVKGESRIPFLAKKLPSKCAVVKVIATKVRNNECDLDEHC
jgi:predicted SAM-dependent methyltransferase